MHGLDWYDYNARFYDPALSVWTTVDPLAEKYYNSSTYAYCTNNPMIYIDPNGEVKIRASVSFSMTTGVIGFAAKVIDVAVGTVFSDGASNGWKAYVEFDTQSMDVKIGATHTMKQLKGHTYLLQYSNQIRQKKKQSSVILTQKMSTKKLRMTKRLRLLNRQENSVQLNQMMRVK